MPPPVPTKLYAAYVQATLPLNGGGTRRKQWIIIPPRRENSGLFLLYHRDQPTLESRIQWRHNFVSHDLLRRDLPEKLEQLRVATQGDLNGWEISPVITCQVTVAEVEGWHKEPKTPWKAIDRFVKVASSRHGLSI